MDNRPTVFIGSSSEGLNVAEAIKTRFGDKAVVDVWNAGNVFSRNQSFFDSLLNASSLYEFAILIFTGDDTTVIRNESHVTVRDNVLFEFGLFLGRVGRRHAHALVQDKLRVPSDFAGIHFDKFELDSNRNPSANFSEIADRIVAEVLGYHENTVEFTQLPSTALAIGYFHNFISRICDQLDNFEPLTIRDRVVAYNSFTLNLVIPDDLRLVDQPNLKNIIRGLEQVKVNNSSFRDFPFYVQGVPDVGTTHLELFDIPTTMKSSRESVRRIFPEENLGRNNLRVRAERREVSNFERTLRLLIDEVPVWKARIKYRYLTEFIQGNNP